MHANYKTYKKINNIATLAQSSTGETITVSEIADSNVVEITLRIVVACLALTCITKKNVWTSIV